jgi:transcriptional regulator with XRE-family HTH domain
MDHEAVRNRTLPQAEAPEEHAAVARLRELSHALRGAEDSASTNDASGAEGAGREAIKALRALKRASAATSRGSPFRIAVLADAAEQFERAASIVGTVSSVLSEDFYLERADLELGLASEDISAEIGRERAEISFRQLAELTGLSLGYLSDLANARVGPPRRDVARKIDDVLGTKIEEIVMRARDRARGLRQTAKEARAHAVLSLGSMEVQRAAAIASAVAADSVLTEVVERIVNLPKEARLGLLSLLQSLPD